jgi:hypothetical protein
MIVALSHTDYLHNINYGKNQSNCYFRSYSDFIYYVDMRYYLFLQDIYALTFVLNDNRSVALTSNKI